MAIGIDYRDEYNLGNLFVEHFWQSKLREVLAKDPRGELTKIMLDTVFKRVPDLADYVTEYTFNERISGEMLLNFSEKAVWIRYPVGFILATNIYEEGMETLEGKLFGDSPMVNYIRLENLRFTAVENRGEKVIFYIDGDIYLKLEYQDKMSDTFTSKGNRALKDFGV